MMIILGLGVVLYLLVIWAMFRAAAEEDKAMEKAFENFKRNYKG